MNYDGFFAITAIIALYYIPHKVYTIALTGQVLQKVENKIPVTFHLEWVFGIVLAGLSLIASFSHYYMKFAEKGWIQPDISSLNTIYGVLQMFVSVGLLFGIGFFVLFLLPSSFGKKRGELIVTESA